MSLTDLCVYIARSGMPDFAVRTAFTATDRVSPAFSRMSRSANAFGSVVRGMLPVLSGAAILSFADKSIEAWKIQEAAVANVEAGLKSTNNAIGLTSQQLQDMASSLQGRGIFGDEAILQNVTAQLLTFGNIGKENFQRVQLAVTDVTAKLKGANATSQDLMSTSIMMGKAMDDPVRGMGAMRRVGISFSQAEEIAVKRMVAMNNVAGAQRLMLQAIERQYGGTNEALSKTTAGMELASKNRLGDSMELLGQQLIPVKIALFEFVNEILPYINYALPIVGKTLKALKIPLLAVAGGFFLWKLGIWGVIAAQKVMMAAGWIKYLWMMRDIIGGAIMRTQAWTAAQWLLNAALNANPLVFVASAILGVYYALKKLYEYWNSTEGKKKIASGEAYGLELSEEDRASYAAAGFGKRKAPNQIELEGKYNNNTNVNIYSNGTEATAEVTPRRGAKINMNQPMGANI